MNNQASGRSPRPVHTDRELVELSVACNNYTTLYFSIIILLEGNFFIHTELLELSVACKVIFYSSKIIFRYCIYYISVRCKLVSDWHNECKRKNRKKEHKFTCSTRHGNN
jgi:hypothetical protein